MAETAKWYVVHTFSGYENKVATNLQTMVENRKLHDLIQEIRVPTETVVELTDNKKREVERKLFPGYVLVKMVMTDDSWYVVRNTRGCTGFVGPESKPVPLTEEEVLALGVEKKNFVVNYAVGDNVRIVDGPLEGFIGIVEELDVEKNSVRVRISMFGRETPVELELDQAEPVEYPVVRIALKRTAAAVCLERFAPRGLRAPVGGGCIGILRQLPRYFGGANNGTKGYGLHQVTDPGRKGHPCAACRPCTGSARRQHHGIY